MAHNNEPITMAEIEAAQKGPALKECYGLLCLQLTQEMLDAITEAVAHLQQSGGAVWHINFAMDTERASMCFTEDTTVTQQSSFYFEYHLPSLQRFHALCQKLGHVASREAGGCCTDAFIRADETGLFDGIIGDFLEVEAVYDVYEDLPVTFRKTAPPAVVPGAVPPEEGIPYKTGENPALVECLLAQIAACADDDSPALAAIAACRESYESFSTHNVRKAGNMLMVTLSRPDPEKPKKAIGILLTINLPAQTVGVAVLHQNNELYSMLFSSAMASFTKLLLAKF